jgi:PEP-CTERM motif-containing protein
VPQSIRFSFFALCLSIAGVSHATLIDRGGGLVYDDVLDVTWLQDVQYSVNGGFAADPRLTFEQALAYADGLDYYDRVRNVTWSDWRLPGVAPDAVAGYDPSGESSELGYMYYVNLGLSPIYLDATKPMFKSDLFLDLSSRAYWTGSVLKPDKAIWVFQFGYGNLGTTGANDRIRAWLVRDGDVGAVPPGVSVPEPTTLALLLAGLLGIALARRRRAA